MELGWVGPTLHGIGSIATVFLAWRAAVRAGRAEAEAHRTKLAVNGSMRKMLRVTTKSARAAGAAEEVKAAQSRKIARAIIRQGRKRAKVKTKK